MSAARGAEPLAGRHGGQRWLAAVRVNGSVAAIAQEQTLLSGQTQRKMQQTMNTETAERKN